ncbi:MAG TPA: glutathione S-transferase family protein [Burkholderiaceae bacterium]|nr:glutathione S-transferase family protein [Burkholderiaceae bacterium]
MRLFIGDKNYSSWSMRPWVALKAANIAFEERLIRLAQDDTAARIAEVSPSGRVPVLEDGELRIWDSLAIIEYVAERFPDRGLWPAQVAARARARCISAEMHAGFAALRTHMSMNIRNRYPGKGRTSEVEAEIARITSMWRDALKASGGPFLFGAWTAADAMYAPVVMRFRTYEVAMPAECEAYMRAVETHPAVAQWVADAHADGRPIARYDGIYA